MYCDLPYTIINIYIIDSEVFYDEILDNSSDESDSVPAIDSCTIMTSTPASKFKEAERVSPNLDMKASSPTFIEPCELKLITQPIELAASSALIDTFEKVIALPKKIDEETLRPLTKSPMPARKLKETERVSPDLEMKSIPTVIEPCVFKLSTQPAELAGSSAVNNSSEEVITVPKEIEVETPQKKSPKLMVPSSIKKCDLPETQKTSKKRTRTVSQQGSIFKSLIFRYSVRKIRFACSVRDM